MKPCALRDAKARLRAVVREACERAPQEITARGRPAIVVLARADDDRLIQPRESLPEFTRRSPPSANDDVALTPEQSLTREVEFRAFWSGEGGSGRA